MRVTPLLACSILLAAAPAFAAAPAHYKLEKSILLGGDGGWDYLTYDADGQRLFLSRATRVMVVDPVSGKVLKEIPGTDGVHGIALAHDLGKVFTSNGHESTVTVFSLKTLEQTDKVKVTGENPDAIVYEPITRRVFTMNGRSDSSTVIDAASDKVVATIPLDGRPEFAVADGKGKVFVNIESKSELSEIDAATGKVVKTWSLAPCESPSGLAMDKEHRRLFSGCDNKLMAVSDADTGKVVATFPIGEGVDATRFDPGTQLVFSSNGEGTLTVAHEDSPDKYTVLENAPTQKFARTMALDPATHTVYLVTADVKVEPSVPEGQRPKRTVLPNSFRVLVMAPKQ
ncbi:MAG TPA: YncE family protein [Gammaproteobacteria bacterium]|nr:YncE family protein [Gammaproteobacteria bacterium]